MGIFYADMAAFLDGNMGKIAIPARNSFDPAICGKFQVDVLGLRGSGIFSFYRE